MWGKYYWTEITERGRSLGRLWIPARPDPSAMEERQFSIPPAHSYLACSVCNLLQSTRENTKYHRGRSLWSQTGGPISSPRNCGPQSCYLLFLRQVLKGPCWRPPQQPIPPVLRISEVWYREQGWRAGKAGTIATTPASCCCMCGWVDICSPEAGCDLSQKFAL